MALLYAVLVLWIHSTHDHGLHDVIGVPWFIRRPLLLCLLWCNYHPCFRYYHVGENRDSRDLG